MSDCFFRQRTPITVEVLLDKDDIVAEATSILNKMAEARFDGQNTQYVNNMQPETDFCQDQNLVNSIFDDGLANIMRRIEPYLDSCEDAMMGGKIMKLHFPDTWIENQETVLATKMKNYLVHYIIAQWLEKVSVSDTAYTTAKADGLLRAVKGVCELRKCRVHRVYNGTY